MNSELILRANTHAKPTRRISRQMFAPPLFAAFIRQFERAVADTKAEYQMSVQVTGLAETVRAAKRAIDAAGGAATRLKNSAEAVVNTIGQVDDMTKQLDAANADLTAAVGVMTNGGPPLETTGGSATTSPPATPVVPPVVTLVLPEAATNATATPGETIDSSIVKVQAQNAAPYVAPPVVTASTIFAEQQAAKLAGNA